MKPISKKSRPKLKKLLLKTRHCVFSSHGNCTVISQILFEDYERIDSLLYAWLGFGN